MSVCGCVYQANPFPPVHVSVPGNLSWQGGSEPSGHPQARSRISGEYLRGLCAPRRSVFGVYRRNQRWSEALRVCAVCSDARDRMEGLWYIITLHAHYAVTLYFIEALMFSGGALITHRCAWLNLLTLFSADVCTRAHAVSLLSLIAAVFTVFKVMMTRERTERSYSCINMCMSWELVRSQSRFWTALVLISGGCISCDKGTGHGQDRAHAWILWNSCWKHHHYHHQMVLHWESLIYKHVWMWSVTVFRSAVWWLIRSWMLIQSNTTV